MRDEDLPCMHNFVDDFFCGGRGLLDRAIKKLQGFSTCKNRAKVYTTFVPYNYFNNTRHLINEHDTDMKSLPCMRF
jgi:hypothetical protein